MTLAWSTTSATSHYLSMGRDVVASAWLHQHAPEIWAAYVGCADPHVQIRFNTLREAKTWCEVTYKLESS